MKTKVYIGLFFAGLLLLAVFERYLIWFFADGVGLPVFVFGLINMILGLFSISCGSLLILWSVWFQFSVGEGTPVPVAATKKLVVSGPYAYTRNPMTLGAAAFFIGISIWFGSAFVFFFVILVFTALLIYIHKHETRELTDRYGVEYLVYKEKTPFLLPCPWFKNFQKRTFQK